MNPPYLHSLVESILSLLNLAASKRPVHTGERLSLRVAVVPRWIFDRALDHIEFVVGGASVAVEAIAATTLTRERSN